VQVQQQQLQRVEWSDFLVIEGMTSVHVDRAYTTNPRIPDNVMKYKKDTTMGLFNKALKETVKFANASQTKKVNICISLLVLEKEQR
jgi:hypothetical protein